MKYALFLYCCKYAEKYTDTRKFVKHFCKPDDDDAIISCNRLIEGNHKNIKEARLIRYCEKNKGFWEYKVIKKYDKKNI